MEKTKQQIIIDKILDDITTEKNSTERYKLIEQLDLFARAIHTISVRELALDSHN